MAITSSRIQSTISMNCKLASSTATGMQRVMASVLRSDRRRSMTNLFELLFWQPPCCRYCGNCD